MTEKSEIIRLYKKLGETPLECIYRFKESHQEYGQTKMTYLGRLDPMAEGLLLVLIGSVKEKENYLGMDKAYEFEVLWSLSTDTHDVLGLVSETGKTPERLEVKIPGLLKKILDKKTQSFPLFSSKVFKGNYLFAREKPVEELYIPEKGIKVFDIKHIHTRGVKGEEILQNISERLDLVKGDFRQEEILREWRKTMKGRERDQFLISKFSADVSSGTYIRGLAQDMGKIIGTPALAFTIKRTRIGEYYL